MEKEEERDARGQTRLRSLSQKVRHGANETMIQPRGRWQQHNALQCMMGNGSAALNPARGNLNLIALPISAIS